MLIDNVLSLIEDIDLLNKLKVKKIVKVIKKNAELQDNIEDAAEDEVSSLIQTMM